MDFNQKIKENYENQHGIGKIRIFGNISNRKSHRKMDGLIFAIGDYIGLREHIENNK